MQINGFRIPQVKPLSKMGLTVFPAAEVKNRRPLELPLPPGLTGRIEHDLGIWRPFLLARRGRWWRGDAGQALWISSDGSPPCHSRIRQRIERRTHERLGIALNPHAFRHAAATSLATEDPGHVGIIQPLLGHADPGTGKRSDNLARGLEAARRYQDLVEASRREP